MATRRIELRFGRKRFKSRSLWGGGLVAAFAFVLPDHCENCRTRNAYFLFYAYGYEFRFINSFINIYHKHKTECNRFFYDDFNSYRTQPTLHARHSRQRRFYSIVSRFRRRINKFLINRHVKSRTNKTNFYKII